MAPQDRELENFRAKSKVRVTRALRTHEEALEYDVRAKRTWAWTQVEKLAEKAKAEAIRLLALREYLKRTDPEPSTHQTLNVNGPLMLGWREPRELSNSSNHPSRSGPSSSNSDASTSSSATEDSARPFWQ